ncbi:MAG: ribosome silencing factor [Rhodothermaceae bacterium]|nr:ribosome silencing factor [Bacteroidota bacterium]MXX97077.1 ribosome silencing factor [Rhodothermaceae bacterium]MXZ16645.1 ribosome silencing factor [Rhodothermaceae bacterium]MXZ57128.1 ribosome silencing factor [Rhodothermaceae bacterium]MYB90826.1 ribosome silencing factor [Rhodothermaceae bacterium]
MVTEPPLVTSSTTPNKKRLSPIPVQILAREALTAIREKKASDVVIMDMHKASGIADYFILCSGTSDIQVKAIAEAVEKRLKSECHEVPWHIEGTEHRQWVLLDYVDLVVHIFTPERREFYDLERLWSDAPIEKVDEGTAVLLQS